MTSVTVVIPVGPYDSNKRWLEEAIDSVRTQTESVEEILLIDDMAHLEEQADDITVWKSPWLMGVPQAFNFGIALAKNELIVMLGSDDKLEPEAIKILKQEFELQQKMDAYYSFTIKYSDDESLQDQPNNCAAVTKGLWKLTGGFPPESAVGACDSIFISMMIRNHRKLLIPVAKGHPLYWYRRHNESDSGTRPVSYQGPIHVVRDIFTTNWKAPEWT